MRPFLGLVAAVVVLSPTALTPAQVMTLKVPENVVVGIPANITIQGGNRPCGGVSIDFGDGSGRPIPYSIRNGVLPYTVSHTWQTEGTFSVKVTGTDQCSGSATAVVTVVKMGPLKPRPKITGYFGLARPGGVAGIVGGAFGSEKGKVIATLKKFNGTPLTVEFDSDHILEWKPGLVGIKWPDVSEVRAQTAMIRVKVGNRFSNDWPVNFVPDSEFKLLPQSDVKVASCSFDANDNVCNSVKDTNACALGVSEWADVEPWPDTDSSIHGWHSNCPAVVGDDSGTDIYRIELKNDWVLETAEFSRDLSGDDGDYVKQPTPAFPRGASIWKVSVKWLASADDEVTYEIQIGITGPKGVPHK